MSESEADLQGLYRKEVLQRFQAASESMPVGQGLQTTDQFLLGRFCDVNNCRRLRNRLSKAGIGSSSTIRGTEISLFVSNEKRSQAFEILDEHRRQDPEVRPKRIGRAYEALFLVGLIGCLVGLLVGMRAPLIGFATGVTAITAGFVIAHVSRNRIWHGRYAFSVVELLVGTGLVAALIALWRAAILMI